MRLFNLRPGLSLLLLLLFTTQAFADTILGGALSLDMPREFRQLSEQELQLKFPSANRPSAAWGNETATVTIAANKRALKLSEEELPQFKAQMRQFLLGARPGLQFQRDEITTINGQKWVHFVFQSEAPDGPIRNEMLMAVKANTLYLLNLNATIQDYPKFSSGLDKARNSLTLK